MGKLNVTILRYLSKDDFRVLTAVSLSSRWPSLISIVPNITSLRHLFVVFTCTGRDGHEESRAGAGRISRVHCQPEGGRGAQTAARAVQAQAALVRARTQV